MSGNLQVSGGLQIARLLSKIWALPMAGVATTQASNAMVSPSTESGGQKSWEYSVPVNQEVCGLPHQVLDLQMYSCHLARCAGYAICSGSTQVISPFMAIS